MELWAPGNIMRGGVLAASGLVRAAQHAKEAPEKLVERRRQVFINNVY